MTTIKDKWESLKNKDIPEEMGEYELIQLERCFYEGASFMLNFINNRNSLFFNEIHLFFHTLRDKRIPENHIKYLFDFNFWICPRIHLEWSYFEYALLYSDLRSEDLKVLKKFFIRGCISVLGLIGETPNMSEGGMTYLVLKLKSEVTKNPIIRKASFVRRNYHEKD